MKKLLNPFALVVEGFLMGACLFIATGGLNAEEPTVTAAVAAEAVRA
jgi:hypothetical protein